MDETVIAYIEVEGLYLMLYRNKKKNDMSEGKWMGVGGHVEPGETIDQAAIRETYEETILRLGVEKVFQLKIPGIKKRNILLIDNNPTKEQPYCRDQREIAPGYYLLSYNNTLKKAQLLEEMSEKLNAHLRVEIITPDGSHQISAPFVNISKPKGRCGQIVNSAGLSKYSRKGLTFCELSLLPKNKE